MFFIPCGVRFFSLTTDFLLPTEVCDVRGPKSLKMKGPKAPKGMTVPGRGSNIVVGDSELTKGLSAARPMKAGRVASIKNTLFKGGK